MVYQCHLRLSSDSTYHIRFLINMYSNKHVPIAWGGVMSDYFSAVNEVKPGWCFKSCSLLYPVYCVYIGD